MDKNENFPNANKIANDDDALYGEAAGGKRVEFAPAPKGQQQAVLVDIRNLGMLPTSFEGQDTGEKPHVLVSWQLKKVLDLPIEEGDDEQTIEFKKRLTGQPYIISQRYVNSLGDKAKMRKHFEAMLGRKLTDAELKPRGFPLEQMIGHNCTLDIVHNVSKKDSKTYANVNGVMGWNTDFGPNIEPRDYVRFKDRPKDANGNILKGEALQKRQELEKMVRDAQNQAATYGVPIPENFDIKSFSDDDLRQITEDYAARIKTARANLRNAGGDDITSGTAPIMTASEAFKKRTGSDPDIFAGEGEEGYIADDAEREKIIAEGKTENPAAVSQPKGLREAQQALEGSKADPADPVDNSNPFAETATVGEGGSILAAAKAQWPSVASGDFPAHLTSLFEAAEEAELPVSDNPLTNEEFISEINTFLTGQKRKAIANVAELKAAPSGVVTKAIREGQIAF
jgi:hypothetical protein